MFSDQHVIRGLLGEVVELGSPDRRQLTPPARELVVGDAQQYVAELGHRLITTRMSTSQLFDPPIRVGIRNPSPRLVAVTPSVD